MELFPSPHCGLHVTGDGLELLAGATRHGDSQGALQENRPCRLSGAPDLISASL